MKKIVVVAACMQLLGCASWKYPNWEYVRIEEQVPTAGCAYKMQESCPERTDECPKWYKQRATKFNANTVVLPGDKKPDNNSVQINNTIAFGGYVPRPVTIAEYYFCNGPKNIRPAN